MDAAKTEARILYKVNKADPEHQSLVVLMLDEFPYGDNYCIVFEKLGCSLYDFIKKYNH